MSLDALFSKLKGGIRSGNHGHSGRPGKIGGSRGGKGPVRTSLRRMGSSINKPPDKEKLDPEKMYGSHLGKDIGEALDWIEGSILSSRLTGNQKDLSEGAKNFLRETVEGNPVLYRGVGIIKARLTSANTSELKSLTVGDKAPNFLDRQVSDIASFTKKKSIANKYSEGSLSVVIKAKDNKRILADLENLPKVLDRLKIPNNFDEGDISYFKTDKEVFVLQPISSTIESIKGSV